jgi:hypothetical protein
MLMKKLQPSQLQPSIWHQNINIFQQSIKGSWNDCVKQYKNKIQGDVAYNFNRLLYNKEYFNPLPLEIQWFLCLMLSLRKIKIINY